MLTIVRWVLSALAWPLEMIAWLGGRAYRHHRGASEMLDRTVA